jgi:hypothetical protein
MGRPKGSKNKITIHTPAQPEDLKAFAQRIEMAVIKGRIKDCESMERLICRILTKPDKNPAIAAMLACKWVEWRYGKPKETHEHKVQVEMTVSDADRIIAGYMAELASSRTLETGPSN